MPAMAHTWMVEGSDAGILGGRALGGTLSCTAGPKWRPSGPSSAKCLGSGAQRASGRKREVISRRMCPALAVSDYVVYHAGPRS
eukprot:scaffold86437_cov62-Phaeocystis_antarctica.AAC.4